MLELQYNGATAANIRVVQKNGGEVFNGTVDAGATFSFSGTDKGTLGTEIKVYVNGNLNATIHTSCSQAIGPGLVAGDFEVVMGYSKNGGELCPLPPTTETPTPTPECDDCKGGVTDLAMKYNGNMENAHIEVTLKDGGQKVFDDIVQPGDEFSFSAPGNTTLDDVIVKITAETEIKGNCDSPIGPGLVGGDFEVTEGHSKEGGLLCAVGDGSSEEHKCKDDDHSPAGDDSSGEHKCKDDDHSPASVGAAFRGSTGSSVWATWAHSETDFGFFQVLRQLFVGRESPAGGKIAVLE